jgi:activator of 2-hydroxyglutaryl-CoA dehydratase
MSAPASSRGSAYSRPAGARAAEREAGPETPVYLGLDVGSISADLVVMTGEREVLDARYVRIFGRPQAVALKELDRLLGEYPNVLGLAVTGSGAKVIAGLLGVPFVNEIVAQSKATAFLEPRVRTIIEIGGTESKLIRLGLDERGRARVEDFAMNAMCAAGTGSSRPRG